MPTILLAIDAFSPLYRLIPAAAFLASRRDSELQCVFAQDSRLLKGVALSCTREIGGHSASCYPVTSRSIEKRMSGIADDMRRRLSIEAERRHLRWSFEQCSGSILQIATETDAEIVVPGWGESQWTDAMRSSVSTHRNPSSCVVAMVDEDSSSAVQVVEAARSLVGSNGPRRLIILLLHRDADAASEGLQSFARHSSEEVEISVDSIEKLIQQLCLLRPIMVLLGREQAVSVDIRLHKTLALIKCPLAMVRTVPRNSTQGEPVT